MTPGMMTVRMTDMDMNMDPELEPFLPLFPRQT